MATARGESGETVSLWLAGAPGRAFPRLERDVVADECDVCIVGAGIAGLSAAYELARDRKRVVVIDQAPVGSGMTGRTTAHFTTAFDDRYFEMEELHGVERVRLLARSHAAAVVRASEIAVRERIDCDVERLDGWLMLGHGQKRELLEKEIAAIERAGLLGVTLQSRAPLATYAGPALRFSDQMQLHPTKYVNGLARAVLDMGGRIYTATHADVIEGGDPARVQTEHGPRIEARAVIVATNTPVNDLAAVIAKQSAYQTYVISARVPAGSVARALYWDTLDPYHYVRLAPARDDASQELLVVGGEDHRTGQEEHPEQRWTRLEEWMRVAFPGAGPVVDRWSGEVMEPADGIAFIGKNPMDDANVYVVTGDSGNGMTHGVLAGILLADLIGNRPNAWAELYSPSRMRLEAVPAMMREQLVVAREYTNWFSRGEAESAAEIPRGEGALVRRGLSLYAVYVDDDGAAHECSAVCPHMGCVVRWNRAERSWDCPCHGSRFDATGHVIHGPAITDLAETPVPRGKRQPNG